MSLTVNGQPNTLTPKRYWRYVTTALVVLAVLAVAWFGVLKSGLLSRRDGEKDLPALKVVISNGCGIEKLAADYRDYIREKNIDVLNLTSTPLPIYNKSLIVVKHGDEQDLLRLQKMTGIQRFTMAVDPDYEAPFVIILGADFEDFMKD